MPARGEVRLTLKPEKAGEKCMAQVQLNRQSHAAAAGFAFSSKAFREGYNVLRILNAGTSAMTVQGVELSLRFLAEEQ